MTCILRQQCNNRVHFRRILRPALGKIGRHIPAGKRIEHITDVCAFSPATLSFFLAQGVQFAVQLRQIVMG